MTTAAIKTYASHYRLTMRGTLYGGVENFSIGVNIAKGHGNSDAEGSIQPSQGTFDDLVADCQAFWAAPLLSMPSSHVLREVKLGFIGTNGLYTRNPFISPVLTTAGALTTGARQAPQVALAVTLHTAKRGPRGRGRFYLPAPGLPLGADARLSDVHRDEVRSAVVTFLDNINNEAGLDALDLGVTVASSYGDNSAVTGVRVGRVFDTIRSRRRSVVEDYEGITPLAVNAD